MRPQFRKPREQLLVLIFKDSLFILFLKNHHCEVLQKSIQNETNQDSLKRVLKFGDCIHHFCGWGGKCQRQFNLHHRNHPPSLLLPHFMVLDDSLQL